MPRPVDGAKYGKPSRSGNVQHRLLHQNGVADVALYPICPYLEKIAKQVPLWSQIQTFRSLHL